MLSINKTKEPNSLLAARKKGAKRYPDDLKTSEIDDLRLKLIQDQGYVCCYCMKRIEIIKDGLQKTKIEHFESRSDDKIYRKHLNYSNLFIACMGNEKDSIKQETCDTFKKDKKIMYFNLLNSKIEEKVFYTKNGYVTSRDDNVKGEIESVLNLNEENLRISREQIYLGLRSVKQRLNKKRQYELGVKQLINDWKNRNVDGKFKAYFGVGVYFLSKNK